MTILMELVFERLSYVSIEAHQPASTNDTDTLSIISGLDYHRHHCLHQQQQPSLADSTMLDSVNITPSSQSTGLSTGRLTSLFGPANPYTYMIPSHIHTAIRTVDHYHKAEIPKANVCTDSIWHFELLNKLKAGGRHDMPMPHAG